MRATSQPLSRFFLSPHTTICSRTQARNTFCSSAMSEMMDSDTW